MVVRRAVIAGPILGLLFLFALTAPTAQQAQPDKPPAKGRPVLIPDDQTQQPPEDAELAVSAPDPAKAEKHYDVGLWYLKMKKYDAAMIRFREAIRNKPNYPEAKWKFVETLSLKKDWKNALQFSTSYLEDPTMAAYKDKLLKIQATARKSQAAAATPAK
jgi:tetratricopeptide (TPR) repeat protein